MGTERKRVRVDPLEARESQKENFHTSCSLLLAKIFKIQQTSQLKDEFPSQTLYSHSFDTIP